MKKKVFNFIVFAILCICFTACSTQEMETPTQTASIGTTSTPRNKQDFWNALDSLNLTYASSATITTRTQLRPVIGGELTTIKINNFTGGKVEDQLGKVAGGWCGKWAGGALGSLSGNPAFTVFGVWAGRRVGQITGAILCSYIAEKYLCEKKSLSLKNFANLNPVGNVYVNNDSMGVIHNNIMHKLTQQSSKYGNSNADYEEIFKDCINLLKQEGIYNDTIATDTKYRKDIIEYCKEIAPLVASCYEGKISGNYLLDSGANSLQQKFNVSDEDIAELKKLSTSVTNTSYKKSSNDINRYANSLSTVIKNSKELNEDEKNNISSLTSIAINSSMYWDNLEKLASE